MRKSILAQSVADLLSYSTTLGNHALAVFIVSGIRSLHIPIIPNCQRRAEPWT